MLLLFEAGPVPDLEQMLLVNQSSAFSLGMLRGTLALETEAGTGPTIIMA